MRILKFGGTSVGSPERIKNLINIIAERKPAIVVLSAMSGVTNTLVQISDCLYKKDLKGFTELINGLEKKKYDAIEELFTKPDTKQRAKDVISNYLNDLRAKAQEPYTLFVEKEILAYGELMSTAFFQMYLEEIGEKSVLIPALSFMRIDKDGDPDMYYIKENLSRELKKHPGVELFITQGFICRNMTGNIDNLKRGGSDYTASIIGAATGASEVQIWTDIDGFHNNDPRIVDKTKAIAEMSFEEAAELAYFGAKILHPSTIFPAREAGIPVWLKNTLDPSSAGTVIKSEVASKGFTAVAAKDNITVIRIKSSHMLLAYGFLRKVFEIFEIYKTPVDVITTSEVAVSVTVDNDAQLPAIVEELKRYGLVEVEKNQTIVCVVGNLASKEKGYLQQIFDALCNVPVHQVSYGGSDHNVTILIDTQHKEEALRALNRQLFNL